MGDRRQVLINGPLERLQSVVAVDLCLEPPSRYSMKDLALASMFSTSSGIPWSARTPQAVDALVCLLRLGRAVQRSQMAQVTG
jgi:hypothetical protein